MSWEIEKVSYGEGPPSPYIEAPVQADVELILDVYGEGPPSPYIEARLNDPKSPAAEPIRGGSPLPLH